MSVRETIEGKCHSCGAVTRWRITHRYIDYHGVTHCFECVICGKVVPNFSWESYQRSGAIMIPV